MKRVLTIGHSTHALEKFIELLTAQSISAVADVRSIPASKFTPQFNREALKRSLRDAGIHYVFLGKELGARSEDPSCYENGRVVYGRLEQKAEFKSGIDRLRHGFQAENIAVMCAEQEPLECHRTLLVAKVLVRSGVPVGHIHADGHVESHDAALRRLMAKFGLNHEDLFHTEEQLLNEALERQEHKVAYVLPAATIQIANHG